ncbi:MAG: hypothetical protein JNN04_02040 [Cyclobacteriaceae bacterium]|nr:hypothetical protein [Cyclobacteriaceae bacterium]
MKQNNTYKKSLLVLAFSFFAVTGAFAQFSVGAELALPMGTPFSDGFNMGFGASANYQKPINDNLSWTAYAGFQSYGGKNLPSGVSATFTMIPIMGGVKYYFTESGNGFYGEFDLGIFFASSSVSGGGFSGSASDSKFGFTPALGYRLNAFDLGVRYNLISDANNLAFRVAYVFGGE